MELEEDRGEDIQERSCVCIGGSVECIEIEIEEEQLESKMNFQKNRRKQLILDAKDIATQTKEDHINFIELSKIYEHVIEKNKQRRGDPYYTAKMSIQNYGSILSQEGIYGQRVSRDGRKIVVLGVDDLLEYCKEVENKEE